MKRIILLIVLISLFCVSPISADTYSSLKLINSTNWVQYFDDLLGYPYDSHGCLHFTPSDIYLLYKTVPAGIPLEIKKYKLKKGEPDFAYKKVPFFAGLIKDHQDVLKHAQMFETYKTRIVVYPSLKLLIILINDSPYAKVKTLPGPAYNFLMAFNVEKGRPIEWDFMLSTPTDPGMYKVLRVTDHYLSSAYYKNTVVPFGAWMKKINDAWNFEKGGKWYKLPPYIIYDLGLPLEKREYSYFDESIDKAGKAVAARWAGHDFGKYVLLWTKDGKMHYPEMGYAAGELVFEQIVLIKDLVHILTMDGVDDLNSCVSKNKSFTFYKELYELVSSKGEKVPKQNKVELFLYSYYRLFNGLKLTEEDHKLMDPRAVKAFKEYKQNRLPRDKRARFKALGLYNYLRVNNLVIEKQAHWYGKLKEDWKFWKKLRQELRRDFDKMGILSLANRQNTLENWLASRLEFKEAALPKQAKYLQDLSFSTFFKPAEETTLFTERERAVMIEKIRKAARGEGQGLSLAIVGALNDYNFGLLLNEILGDLYKSHGCMHVSPRNSYFLYELLPEGALVNINKYNKKLSKEAVEGSPFLADMVNYADDLEKLKENFQVTSEVKVGVYPFSGYWIIYVKDKPFAKVLVRGGPQARMYLLQGRDKNGKPIFEGHLAYPTSPGTYYIFKRIKDYVSNIYHDTTIIPQGGIIKREGNKWIFKDKEGKLYEVPRMIKNDLSFPSDDRKYTYYDTVKNVSGEVEEMRWGSHPFGIYALQTTKDKRHPFPELIHSSGDLIMEERQIINDLIKILSAPFDDLDKCIKYSQNFDLYKTCYDYTRDPYREDLIQARERAAYKLYYGLPLTTVEVKSLPQDVIIANKVLKKKKLTKAEIKVLINEGIAYYRSGKLKMNMQKILGLQFDTYQFVVTVQKYAHHYGTLKKHWKELSGLRRALLKDFNDFVIKDTQLFHNFMRELMLRRTRLEKLDQEGALQILNGMLNP